MDLRFGVQWCDLYRVAQRTINAPRQSQRRLDRVCKFKFISAWSKLQFCTRSFRLRQINTRITHTNAFTPSADDPSCSLLSKTWDMISNRTEIIGSRFISSELSAGEIKLTAKEIHQQQFTACRGRTAASKQFSAETCSQHVAKSEQECKRQSYYESKICSTSSRWFPLLWRSVLFLHCGCGWGFLSWVRMKNFKKLRGLWKVERRQSDREVEWPAAENKQRGHTARRCPLLLRRCQL